MPPTIVFIRHAQAVHNLGKANHVLHDPNLTDLGRQQCLELREHLQTHLPADRKIQLIITSPMRRAIQTTLIALDWLIDSGVPVIPDARWQENYPKPCDTGTPAPTLATEFPQLDFSTLDPVYPDKTSPAGAAYHFSKTAVLARGQAALADLYARPEDVVVVMSHSGFLRTAVVGRWFGNADYRVFDFVEGDGDGDREGLGLVEWELTRGKGGMGGSKGEVVALGEGLPEE
ncbi:histidine phosphatase superfamily [Chaetomium fimeti]|uniref:Histidine phosphatase superfamily n=1 Tax=Chaetomium fimeti TaxID=1854472 RepID=A0AAE0HAN5_9PEZI|nr:histidine phosphatase superfamily [Chaetomium fimeti]